MSRAIRCLAYAMLRAIGEDVAGLRAELLSTQLRNSILCDRLNEDEAMLSAYRRRGERRAQA